MPRPLLLRLPQDRRTCVHANQHIIRTLVALQYVLVEDFFITLLLYLALEEYKIVEVIPLICQVFAELHRIAEVLQDGVIDRLWGTLIRFVVVVLPLDLGWRSAKGI